MEPLRTAVIGCGKVGQIHAQILRDLPGSRLVAVCDSSPDRAEEFARRFGGRAFTDVDAMLAASSAQVVTICTPHPLHADAAIRAARAGAHVLGEDGRAVVAMFTAIYRSRRELRPIPFPVGA